VLSFSLHFQLHFFVISSSDHFTLLNSLLVSGATFSPCYVPGTEGPSKSSSLSILCASFYFYPFIVHFSFFLFLLWSEHAKEKAFLFLIPLFCATVFFGRVTASTRYERQANSP